MEYDIKQAIIAKNKSGMYLPNQITDEVDKYWDQYAEADANTVNKEICMKIV